jgi:hypothetical protein
MKARLRQLLLGIIVGIQLAVVGCAGVVVLYGLYWLARVLEYVHPTHMLGLCIMSAAALHACIRNRR